MQFHGLLRSQPFTRLLVPLIPGIISGFYYHPDIYIAGAVMIGLSSATVVIHKLDRNYRSRWLYGVAVNLQLLFAGLLSSNIQYSGNEKVRQLSGEKILYEAIVSDDMIETGKSSRTILRVRRIHGDTIQPGNFKVVAYFNNKDSCASKLQAGDILMVHSVLNEIEEPQNPYEFNYKRLMRHRGVILNTYISGTAWQKTGRSVDFKTFISELKHRVVNIYEKSGISNDELAVLSALTLGIRESLPAEIKQSFAVSGAMHVLAVSGLHVGIIYLILNTLLSFARIFRYGKFLQSMLIIFFLWFFAFLTGLRPPVVRAVFMFSIIQTGNSLKRLPDIYNTISLSAFCLLLINPYQLTDIGFQLSYFAITGIIFFQPKIYRLLYIKNSFIDKIWQLFTVSVAAQLVTAPLTIYYFHYFPVYFWLTNFFVIVLTGLILYMAVFQILIFALHLPYLFTGGILNFFLKMLNGLTCQVRKLPCPLIENINISLFETVLCYVIIISVTIYLLKRNQKALKWSLITLLAMTVYKTAFILNTATQSRLVVFNVRNSSIVGLVKGSNIVFLPDLKNAPDICQSFQVKNYLIKRGIKHLTDKSELSDDEYQSGLYFEHAGANIFFETGHFRGILLKDFNGFRQNPAKKLKLDCIILSQNADVSMNQLTDFFLFRQIILDSSNSYTYSETWLKTDLPDGFVVHSVAENKAIEIRTRKNRIFKNNR
jgi:competence protein ComEC